MGGHQLHLLVLKENPSHSLRGEPSFLSSALWVSLRSKVTTAVSMLFSTPPLDESWADTLTSVKCLVLVHKINWSQVQLYKTDLSAQLVRLRSLILKHRLLSQGDNLPG